MLFGQCLAQPSALLSKVGQPRKLSRSFTHTHTRHTLKQVEVLTPEDHMGDVIGDLNSRRGLINKFDDKPGERVAEAAGAYC